MAVPEDGGEEQQLGGAYLDRGLMVLDILSNIYTSPVLMGLSLLINRRGGLSCNHDDI